MSSENGFWFRINLGPFFLELRPKSPLSCLLTLLLFLVFLSVSVVLTIKIYSIVFPILVKRLGITSGVGIALLIATALCARINIPLYLVAVWNNYVRYELFPIWLLRFNNSAYRTHFQPHTYVGINVTGGLIPLTLALYQFSRTPPSAIFTVTAIVAVISYFFVRVEPGVRIYFKSGLFWVVTLITALSALWVVVEGTDRADASVAFAGGVLGTLIGADLLHLKDIQPEKAMTPLSIGGAGLDDGIALCGLYSLLLAEWIPNLFAFLKL